MSSSAWPMSDQASSQRRSACSRSTMPSSSSPATERSGSAIVARSSVPQPPQQFMVLRVDHGQRVGQPRRRCRHQLQMNFRQVRLGPAHFREPAGDLLLACCSSARTPCGPAGPPARPACRARYGALLSSRVYKDHVDPPVVHRVPERAEVLPQPRAQLQPCDGSFASKASTTSCCMASPI